MRLTISILILSAIVLAACTDTDSIRRKDRAPLNVPGLVPSATPITPSAATEADQTVIASREDSATGSQRPNPIIVRGSGAIVGSPPPETGEQAGQGDITLNFVEADIRDVIKSVLGDILGLTYTIAPSVTGKITIKTNSPLNRSELIPTLEEILQDRGFALLVQGNTYTISPVGDVKSAPFTPDAMTNGYGSQVVRLHHIAAAEMEKILQQYGQPNSAKVIGSATNLIVLTGPAPQRQNLVDIISMFDVDRFKGMSFAIFPVTSADPDTVISELKKIFEPAIGSSNMKGFLEFVPIDRQNAILMITADPSKIDEVGNWIDRLDKGETQDQPELYVHYVQHGDAKHIADVLREIFDTNEASSKTNAPDVVGATMPNAATQRNSSMEMQTPPPPLADNASLTGQNVLPSEPSANNSPAEGTVADAPQAAAEGDASATSSSKGQPGKNKIKIIADEANNAIFILATPKDYKLIGAALRHIDVTSLQVLIEATIAEVTLNDELKYGVEWFFKSGNSSVTFSDLASGAVTAAFPGFNYFFSSSNAKVLIQALDKVSEVKVISSPQLMVLDNKTAKLQVGDQVPITTQTAVSVETPGAPIVNSVEFKDTGVILTVKPRVNSSGSVEMDIEQEVSDVVPTTTSNIDSPTIQQRKVKSSVTVQDGQTIALGGLIRDNQSKGTTGIPLLSDIPVLGNLFKTNDNKGDRTELLILITPHVVRDPGDAKDVTDELRRRLQAVTPLNDKIQ